MSKNHRNRSWRNNWAVEPENRIAVHKSGLTARVYSGPIEASKDKITIDNADKVDVSRWNLEQLSEQALKLWREGAF